MVPQAKITPTTNGLQELKIEGLFHHPHWMVFLLSGLADRQISVLGGCATQQISYTWEAVFQLDFRNSSFTPDSVQYLALTGINASYAPAAPPILSEFQMRRRTDNALEIIVQGPDQIGFLSKLLGGVSLLALYPTELEINTVGGQIKDRVVLRGIGGSAPRDSTEDALQTLLQGYVNQIAAPPQP